MVDGLKLEKADGVATLTLDRPDALNALTFDIYAALPELLRSLGADSAVRAVVLTGAGKGFCSGGSVHEIIKPLLERPPREVYRFARMTCDVIEAMRALRRPIVAAVNGVAVGAGAILALASDLRLASQKARFGFLFNRVGLSGADMGACYLLPRVVGLGNATELLMRGNVIDAAEALRIGLVSRVVAPEALEAEARALALELARGPAFALGLTKEMLDRAFTMDLHAALEAEAQAQALCMTLPEFREGHDAFVEKRAPDFRRFDP
ncbi:MAG TPA: enoyl-CoA hydratase family protein [Myxococcota bacterium]|jgi:enoyl-CoA hydratase/carnithine racemase|nr:enoyl-CoA hydratase family protein [Myxococcota bacterium]